MRPVLNVLAGVLQAYIGDQLPESEHFLSILS